MFIFDVETLSVESTCVILSAALIYFDPEQKPTYQDLLDSALFVKLNSKDQVKRLGRTVDSETLNWWKTQHEYLRRVSFEPAPKDLIAEDAIAALHSYMNKYQDSHKHTMWARGSLDQMAIDSLCKRCGMEPLTNYAMWRDVRTAVDILTGSSNGYCDVNFEGFDRAKVIKHHPVHDCALDGMMLLYGK